jgi:uncharacterized membrane protein
MEKKTVTFKEQFAKLVDLKSIITFLLVATLIFLVTFFAVSAGTLDEKLFNLFSNIITMTVTYFFTRKMYEKKDEEEKG